VAAKMAVQARHVMVERHAVANLPSQFRDARPELGNHAGGFVSKNARRRHGAVLDFFDVGGADAAHGDFDEQFVGADARDGDGFEAEIVDAAIDDGAHGFGDVGHGNVLTQRRQDAKAEGGGIATKTFWTAAGIPQSGSHAALEALPTVEKRCRRSRLRFAPTRQVALPPQSKILAVFENFDG
jgi:hypothetical protein